MAFDENKIRLFVEATLDAGVEVDLASDQVHYLRNVTRRSEWDTLYFCRGRHGEWQGVPGALTKKAGTAVVRQTVRI